MRYILDILVDFGLAWRLLTIIPLPSVPENVARPAGRAAAYYPLVGLILGLLLAGTGWLFYWLLPVGVATALLLAIWAGLTGLLHLDGFMDACDGLIPPRDSARRLEIMKDSQVGAFGVVGVILLLLLKFNGLLALPAVSRWPALIIIPVLARWAMTWAMARYPLARTEGLSIFFKAGLGWLQVGIASVITIWVTLGFFGVQGITLLAVTWFTTILVARFAIARVGGLTGDIYGATCEVTEVVLLITVIVMQFGESGA